MGKKYSTVADLRVRVIFLCLTVVGIATSAPFEPLREEGFQGEPASVLKALNIELMENEVRAIVEADGVLDHKFYLLEEPPQLILDIMNVQNPLPDQELNEPHSLLKAVRCQELPMTAYVQGASQQTFGRIMFDLKVPAQYWVQESSGRLNVGMLPKGVHDSPEDVPRIDLAEPSEVEDHTQIDSAEPAVEEVDPSVPSEYSIEPDDVDPSIFFGPVSAESGRYRLGPQDVLEIRVFELEQLNRTVRVLADGNITLPLVGQVNVNGLTSPQAADQVAAKLQNKYVQDPQVSVLIKEFNSRKVSLLGAVAQPASYPLVGRRSLLQILADAGGLGGNAGSVLYVFRPLDDGRSARLAVPLGELLINGDPRWNILLEAGDIISVPPEEAISILVLGAVRSPGIIKLPVGEGASLSRAIALAGGLNERASKSGIQIKRREAAGEEAIFKANLDQILSGKKPDVILHEGDVVVVKERFF